MENKDSIDPNDSETNWRKVVFARSENVVRRDVAGETILVPLTPSGAADVEYLYRMNAVGTAVWDAMDGRSDAFGIVATVLSEFDTSGDGAEGGIPRESVERDVRGFLDDLEKSGLANRVTSADGGETH